MSNKFVLNDRLRGRKEHQNMNETPVYNLKDLSKKLKISIRTLREYIKSGELKAKKVGRAYYITEPKLMAFLSSES